MLLVLLLLEACSNPFVESSVELNKCGLRVALPVGWVDAGSIGKLVALVGTCGRL